MHFKKPIYFFLFIILSFFCMSGFAQTSSTPDKPFPPFRIAGNLYYVGSEYQADYLIVTPQGSILINSGFKVNVPMIKASIEKLGFKFRDIKILLISQAHADHNAGIALLKAKTGANYQVMSADVPVVQSGGKADFQYGSDAQSLYKPAKVSRVLHDGDKVRLGNTVLVAHLTPGHTKGCTTWTMKVAEKGKSYHVVIVGGVSVNPGYKLVRNAAYPTIAKDYQHTFHVLKSLPCDIFLGAHGGYFGLKEKYARMKKGEKNVFVDPEGYKKFIMQAEEDFNKEWKKQNEF